MNRSLRCMILIVISMIHVGPATAQYFELIPHQKDGKWGFIEYEFEMDTYGRMMIPAKYDTVTRFLNGAAMVCLSGNCGLVDKNGKEIVAMEYEYAQLCPNKRLALNKEGKWILKDYYESEEGFYAETISFTVVAYGGGYGFLDHEGNELTPFKYDYARSFMFNGGAYFVEGRGWGIIGEKGNEITEPLYEEIAVQYTWGSYLVTKNYKYGMVDHTGRELTEFKYTNFQKGSYYDSQLGIFMFVQIGTKYGSIDKYGKELVPVIYDGIRGYDKASLEVKQDGQWTKFEVK